MKSVSDLADAGTIIAINTIEIRFSYGFVTVLNDCLRFGGFADPLQGPRFEIGQPGLE
jgi:hypothetical protein